MEFRTGFMIIITNYLDDFLLIAYTIAICNELMECFIRLCELIGCPTSEEKTEWAAECVTFLGMLLDGHNFTISVPVDKRTKAISLLDWVLDKNKITIKLVQRLTGILNFLNRAIVPGCAFTRSMYDKLRTKGKDGKLLKQHHHVSVGKQFKLDAKLWRFFFQNATANDLCCPFVDFNTEQRLATVLNFYTDTAKSDKLGIGAVYNNQWMCTKWDPLFINNEDPSIEFLEPFYIDCSGSGLGQSYEK